MTNLKITPSRFRPVRLSRALAVLGFLALPAGWLCAGPLKYIAISAAAVPAYVRPPGPDGKPRPESYVFTQGNFFGGDARHGLLDETKFDDIVKALAPNLARQNYFPTRDVPSANIMIMVHWGVTSIDEDPQKEFVADKLNEAMNEYNATADNGNADPGALNAALNDQAYTQRGVRSNIVRNAALLGYKPALQKEQAKYIPSTDELTMSEELNEKRYFVILMAYDYQRMKKERTSQLLWITRISVRSPGNNFLEAMPALAEAGAAVYGRHVDGLLRVNAGEKSGRVDLGELKIIGTVEEPKSGEKRK